MIPKRKIINGWKLLWSAEGSLKKKAVRSGFWAFLLRVILRAITLIRTLILARILAPQDFGLFGVALLTLSVLETFSETGFQQALIQKRSHTRKYLDATWTALLLRGILLFIILYFIAHYAAIFFSEPRAEIFIRIVGFSVLIRSLANIGIVYFQKELNFAKEFIYQFGGAAIDLLVTIIVVLGLRNIWALVFGLLAGDLVRLTASYLIHPYRPKFELNLKKISRLFSYGKWVLGSSILAFFLNQGDDALVGKMLGVTTLGLYQMAYRISNLPVTEISLAINPVTFPAYSKLQDNLPKLRKAYLKVLQITAFLSFPLSGLIIASASDFTRLILGERWLPMVPTLQLLTLTGLLTALGSTAVPIFYSLKKPGVNTKLQVIQLALLGALILPFTLKWGMAGTALSLTLATFLAVLVEIYRIVEIVNLRVNQLLTPLLFPLVSTAMAIWSVLMIKAGKEAPVDSVGLLFMASAGVIVYLGTSYLLERFSGFKGWLSMKKFIFPREPNDGKKHPPIMG